MLNHKLSWSWNPQRRGRFSATRTLKIVTRTPQKLVLETSSTNSTKGWFDLCTEFSIFAFMILCCLALLADWFSFSPQIKLLMVLITSLNIIFGGFQTYIDIMNDKIKTYTFDKFSGQLTIVFQSLKATQTFEYALSECKVATIEEKPLNKFWNAYWLVLWLKGDQAIPLTGTRAAKRLPKTAIV
jgi:hypothetical protein